MRSDLLPTDVRRRLQHGRARRQRSNRPADRRARASVRVGRIGSGTTPATRAIRHAVGTPTVAERQAIAGLQRPSVEAAHAADQMRRAAAEHRRRRRCRRRPRGRRARRAMRAPKRSRAPARDSERRVVRHAACRRRVTSNSAPVTATTRSSSNSSSGPSSVTSSVAASDVVADERVREPMRIRIHRPGDRHAARLKSPAAEVLDGRQHAGLTTRISAAVTRTAAPSRRTRRRSIG